MNNLNRIFRSPNAQRAIDRIIDTAVKLGLNLTAIDFIRDMLFGYIEGYLNGAVCPICYSRLGHAKDIPDYTYCPHCEKKIGVIKITPLRVYLAIANNADLFRLIPDQIKVNPNVIKPLKRFKNTILRLYDAITVDTFSEPLIAWIKDNRPDLYYTIAFYPLTPKYIQALHELEMDRMSDTELQELREELGLKDADKDTLKKVIIEGLEMALDRRSEYHIVSGNRFVRVVGSEEEAKRFIEENKDSYPGLTYIKVTGVSTYALKTFITMIDDLKNKLRDELVRQLSD